MRRSLTNCSESLGSRPGIEREEQWAGSACKQTEEKRSRECPPSKLAAMKCYLISETRRESALDSVLNWTGRRQAARESQLHSLTLLARLVHFSISISGSLNEFDIAFGWDGVRYWGLALSLLCNSWRIWHGRIFRSCLEVMWS